MKIREVREEKGISQKALAALLGVSPTNIYNYEIGRTEPSIDMLKKIASVLEISVDYLIGNSDDFVNVSPTQSNITEKESRLLKAFSTLSDLEQDKLIADAEFYSMRHRSKLKL